MSYPKEVKAFIEWSKAMVAGATVERPKLKATASSRPKRKRRGKRRFYRIRRKQNKED